MNEKKVLKRTQQILALIYIAIYTMSSFAFAFSYPFGHINDTGLFQAYYLILQVFRFSAYLVIPLAIFSREKYSRSLLKLVYPFIILVFITFPLYTSLDKNELPYYNANSLTQNQIEIYDSINSFMPNYIYSILFVLEIVSVFILALLVAIEDGYKLNDLKGILLFPLVMLFSVPLNIFENVVREFSESTYEALYFSNFNYIHILLFLLVGLICFASYFLLRNKGERKQKTALRFLALVMFQIFLTKNSMLVGDGYNIYNNVFASIPFFICDMGKIIVVLALFLDKKILYKIAFFVHSAGAVSVFFYLGREGTHNYGTVLSYSFLYFTITHLLLLLTSLLPYHLHLFEFKIKDITPTSLYYLAVIMIASFISPTISHLSMTYTDSLGCTLSSPILPNYAFTQVCPLPISFPTFWTIQVFSQEVNMIYELSVFLFYVALFLAFFLVNKTIDILKGKIREKALVKNI